MRSWQGKQHPFVGEEKGCDQILHESRERERETALFPYKREKETGKREGRDENNRHVESRSIPSHQKPCCSCHGKGEDGERKEASKKGHIVDTNIGKKSKRALAVQQKRELGLSHSCVMFVGERPQETQAHTRAQGASSSSSKRGWCVLFAFEGSDNRPKF